MKIIIVGTAYPYRGGLAAFNERLAAELQVEGHDVEIVTFSLQYPSFLFPGKTQYADWEAPQLNIKRWVNSINPFNWFKVGRNIKRLNPDMVIMKYWTPFMAPCLGTIARRVRANKKTKVLCIVDNMIPHEKHFYDTWLSRYFVSSVDAFIAMSQSVMDDIDKMNPNKPRLLTPHPLFDNFSKPVDRKTALEKLNLSLEYRYFLFFGFIRAYKGLDWLLEAFADERLRKYDVKLIVAGEFYDNEKTYKDIVKTNHIEDAVIWRTDFIPDAEVVNYFCAADMIVQPYKDATQSGVTQIAYYYVKPMLVTNVGGLSEIVPDGKVGYVVEPNIKAIADALVDFLEHKKENAFKEGIEDERQKYQWNKMTMTLTKLYNELIQKQS